jgi:Tol biopolymer transport system component
VTGLVWKLTIGLCLLCLLTMAMASGLGRLDSRAEWIAFWALQNGQRSIRVLDPERLLEAPWSTGPAYQTLSPPSVARNGRMMVYDMLHDGSEQGILIQDSDGRILYRTPQGLDERLPSISPDGQQVAFWSQRTGLWQAYVMTVDGGSLRQLTTRLGQLPYNVPIWSPVGHQVVLRFWQPGGDAGYFIADLPTGNLRYIRGYVDAGGDLTWSPDGARMLFRTERDRNGEIYLFNTLDNAVQNLTQSPGTDFQPQWSPDGEWIAFVSNRRQAAGIYVMHEDGSAVQRVYAGSAWSPMWSPDGRSVAFFARREGTEGLYLLNLLCVYQSRTCDAQPQFLALSNERNILLGWFHPVR